MSVFRKLMVQPDYYNRIRPSVQSLAREAETKGWGAALSERLMWNRCA